MKKDVIIPNLGGLEGSKVIDVLVKAKEKIKKDQALVTLESDKASMDVPSPYAGTVESIKIKEGDAVSEGDVILSLSNVEEAKEEKVVETKEPETVKKSEEVYASPFVRRMAHELDIDLSTVTGSGEGNRITMDDMKAFLMKAQPKAVDYSKWGKVKFEAFNAIQAASASHLIEAWQSVPQVTQHHWVDVTELEEKRQAGGKKVTMVALVMKAIATCMTKHPAFCRGWVGPKEYVLREYIHIGVAVDTGGGLVVPVCRDVDKKDVLAIAKEVKELSERARSGKLKVEDLEGRCASLSSLGGIGGGHFTPIVSSPDAFVLGVSRTVLKGMYLKDKMEKRLMLPVSLSYDHRLIDGADGARFLMDLEQCLLEMPAKIGE